MDVNWDNVNKSVTATNETTTIALANNSYTGYVNGVEYQLHIHHARYQIALPKVLN